MLCWREGRQWTVPLPDYFVMVFTVVRWEIYISVGLQHLIYSEHGSGRGLHDDNPRLHLGPHLHGASSNHIDSECWWKISKHMVGPKVARDVGGSEQEAWERDHTAPNAVTGWRLS